MYEKKAWNLIQNLHVAFTKFNMLANLWFTIFATIYTILKVSRFILNSGQVASADR